MKKVIGKYNNELIIRNNGLYITEGQHLDAALRIPLTVANCL